MLRRNQNLNSSKVCAIMAALILTLTCMPGFTIRAGSFTTANLLNQQKSQRTTRVFVDGKEVKSEGVTTPQNQAGGRRSTNVQWKDDHGSSGTLSAKDIELTTDSKDINAIAKDGYLAIDETNDGVRRRLRIEPASDGKLKRTYSVNGVAREMDDEAKAWLAGILHNFLDPNR